MRCCIQTINERESEEADDVGTLVHCNWCNGSIVIADDGIWEWYRA